MYDVHKINQLFLGDSAYILTHPYRKISPKVSLLSQTITDTIKYSGTSLRFATNLQDVFYFI